MKSRWREPATESTIRLLFLPAIWVFLDGSAGKVVVPGLPTDRRGASGKVPDPSDDLRSCPPPLLARGPDLGTVDYGADQTIEDDGRSRGMRFPEAEPRLGRPDGFQVGAGSNSHQGEPIRLGRVHAPEARQVSALRPPLSCARFRRSAPEWLHGRCRVSVSPSMPRRPRHGGAFRSGPIFDGPVLPDDPEPPGGSDALKRRASRARNHNPDRRRGDNRRTTPATYLDIRHPPVMSATRRT